MSRNRDFLAEFLQQRQAAQAPTPQLRPQALPAGQPIAAPQAAQQTGLSAGGAAGGLVPLPELDARQALAKSLIDQSQDRNAHPLARGIAAFFGHKNLQEIGAERGRTESAIREAELERARLQREEDLGFKRRAEAREDIRLGLEEERAITAEDLQRQRLGLEKRRLESSIEAGIADREIAAQERVRRADLEERKLGLQERVAEGKIAERDFEREQTKIQEESDLIDSAAQAENSIKLVNDLLEHPGFGASVGATLIPGQRFVPGTDAADFSARFDQIKGEAFLNAFQKLKGGGTITEQEGKKAESALARMQLSQSEKEFRRAAEEFRDTISDGLEREKKRAKKRGVDISKLPSSRRVTSGDQSAIPGLSFEGFE